MRPWSGDAQMRTWWSGIGISQFYSWMAIVLGTLVFACVASEFIRGGRVLREKLNTNLAGAMYHLTRRNMRRYGGYIAHICFAVVVISLAGLAFNQKKEQEIGQGDRLRIGRYQTIRQACT